MIFDHALHVRTLVAVGGPLEQPGSPERAPPAGGPLENPGPPERSPLARGPLEHPGPSERAPLAGGPLENPGPSERSPLAGGPLEHPGPSERSSLAGGPLEHPGPSERAPPVGRHYNNSCKHVSGNIIMLIYFSLTVKLCRKQFFRIPSTPRHLLPSFFLMFLATSPAVPLFGQILSFFLL